MSKYQDQLIEHITSHPKFIQPESRRNEILGFLKKDLQDLCISRPKKRLAWGIELPFDENYVTYVWFDALLNYISAIGWNSNEKQFDKYWRADYHLMAQDILPTHCNLSINRRLSYSHILPCLLLVALLTQSLVF